MKETNWSEIHHFSKRENWGDWTKVDKKVIIKLDQMREYCGKLIVIHCAYEKSGHTNNSQHYLGKAVDINIIGMKLVEQYLLAERFGWTGIGLYNCWKNPGLHLDLRDEEIGARWAQKKNREGSLEYCALDQKYIELCIAMEV